MRSREWANACSGCRIDSAFSNLVAQGPPFSERRMDSALSNLVLKGSLYLVGAELIPKYFDSKSLR